LSIIVDFRKFKTESGGVEHQKTLEFACTNFVTSIHFDDVLALALFFEVSDFDLAEKLLVLIFDIDNYGV
jgi:hypothetical protein